MAIGASTAMRPGVAEFAQGVAGDDVDDLAVLRQRCPFHDPDDLAELPTHLIHNRASRPRNRIDEQARKEEHHRGADDRADDDVG